MLLLFGVLGYAMVKFGFPLAPFILGVILGDQIEINLVRAIMTDSNPWLFFTRPISGALLALPCSPSSLPSGSTGGIRRVPRRRRRRTSRVLPGRQVAATTAKNPPRRMIHVLPTVPFSEKVGKLSEARRARAAA